VIPKRFPENSRTYWELIVNKDFTYLIKNHNNVVILDSTNRNDEWIVCFKLPQHISNETEQRKVLQFIQKMEFLWLNSGGDIT
jgi:hypothetical protein